MLKSRLFEEAVSKLWHDGLISGEMHLGTGEEAIIAGVVAHLRQGDAMALDHRGTAALPLPWMDPTGADAFVPLFFRIFVNNCGRRACTVSRVLS